VPKSIAFTPKCVGLVDEGKSPKSLCFKDVFPSVRSATLDRHFFKHPIMAKVRTAFCNECPGRNCEGIECKLNDKLRISDQLMMSVSLILLGMFVGILIGLNI
jgi:hypothetical protein